MRTDTEAPAHSRGPAGPAVPSGAGAVRGEAVYALTGPYACVQVPLRLGIAALDRIRRDGGTVGPVLVCHPHHVVHILTPPGSESVWEGVPAAVAAASGTTDCGSHWGPRYWIVPPGADEHRVDAGTLRSALADPHLKEDTP